MLPVPIQTPAALTSADFHPVPSRFGTFEGGNLGMVEVLLQAEGRHLKWMFLDSGMPVTFFKSKAEPSPTLDLLYATGIKFEIGLSETPDASEVDMTALPSDGILGADNLKTLTWLVDYRHRSVWVRLAKSLSPEEARRETAVSAALRAMGRKPVPTLAFRVEYDRDSGLPYTKLALGKEPPRTWYLDTGSNLCFLPRAFPNPGPSLYSAGTSTPRGPERATVHLVPARLGGATVPLMVAKGAASRDDFPVLAPYALTRDWVLFDLNANRVTIPRPTPATAAIVVAETLTKGFLSPSATGLGKLASVASPADLARARREAKRLHDESYRAAVRAGAPKGVERKQGADIPAPPRLPIPGYHWIYLDPPGRWQEIPDEPLD